MIVFRTPKGWTGPQQVDGHQVEGTWRAHQVPMGEVRTNADHRALLETLAALVPARGAVRRPTAGCSRSSPSCAPTGTRRMSANPVANGGELLRDLDLPDFRAYAVDVPAPGATTAEATRVLGTWLRDVMRPQPTRRSGCSGRTRRPPTGWTRVLEVTDRTWMAEIDPRRRPPVAPTAG